MLLAFAASASAQGPQATAGTAGDPRIPLVDQQVERNHPEALQMVERVLADDPAAARRLGLEYLHARLLQLLGRRQEALEAFASTMVSAPALQSFSRYRLAIEQEAQGHPEIAAGLLATLLRSNSPRSLVTPSVRLLQRTLARGGDCRLLRGLESMRWGKDNRRRLTLARALCAEREGDLLTANRVTLGLLEENRADDVARTAAESLVAAGPEKRDARIHLLLGLTFYNHREFEKAIHHLARTLVQLPTADNISRGEDFECRYALARSHFWLGRYGAAAAAYDALAKSGLSSERRAQVLYQKARSIELVGDWETASATFQEAYLAAPTSRRWADAALISRLRLEWLRGEESNGLSALQQLLAHRRHSTAARAFLFLASSDLTRGRSERAEPWLTRAADLSTASSLVALYWRGRLAELEGRFEDAATLYAGVLGQDPYHPFGTAAGNRLRQGPASQVARQLGQRMASSRRPDELYVASRLLGSADPRRKRVLQTLQQLLEADGAAAPFLSLDREPTERWPLWQAALKRPEEMLLTLGIFDEGASVVLRHFPVAEPTLAFTGSLALARSGETKQSLYIAEILAQRIPRKVPSQLLTASYRQLLFPMSYRSLIERECAQRNVDPYLLAAIIREESRFDPRAFSSASARGLTQFVFPTARRIAEKIDLGPITPSQLEEPEMAIRLGAAYLEELLAEFDGAVHQVIAAYNAGEPQADLWRRYCYSEEPEEYLTKVAFRQTRGYLTKVLTSRAHYAELYAPSRPAVD